MGILSVPLFQNNCNSPANREIILRLSGGFGNQLFQFSQGFSLSQETGRPLRFDSSWYDHFQRHKPPRSNMLRACGLLGPDDEFLAGIPRFFLGLSNSNSPQIRKPLQQLLGKIWRIRFLNEGDPLASVPFNQLWPGPLPATRNLLNGYWQTAQPAETSRTFLRKRFFDTWEFSRKAAEYLHEIQQSNAFFLHIRRGDYQSFGIPILADSYYRRAIDLVTRVQPQATWFVFSESFDFMHELDWLPGDSHFVHLEGQEGPNRDFEEFLLMASCRGGVVANSSFSWWGARLIAEPQMVVLPDKWIRPGAKTPAALVPNDWTLCPA